MKSNLHVNNQIFTEYFVTMLSLKRNRLKIISEEFISVFYIWRTLKDLYVLKKRYLQTESSKAR